MKRSFISPLLTGVLSLFLVFAFQNKSSAECHALFGYSQTPGTLLVTFHDSSSSSFEITTWHWDFGDGHSSNDHNITHTYSAPGTYQVCLTIHDNHDCNDTYCHAVVVAPIQNNCSAFFTSEQAPNTLSVHFLDGSESNHDINSWSWTFGDGGTSDNHAPTHIYNQPGTYEVCLTIHDNTGCTSTYCHNVIVAPLSSGDCMSFFGYYQDANTLTIHFIDSSSSSHDITTWHWDFGDGHSSNDHNISHTYSAPGTYEVCLTIHDNGDCNDTYCHAVVVLPVLPGDCVAFFTTEQTPGTLSVHFIDGSESNHDINSWLWTFGDGHSSDNHAPTHIYDAPGTYQVCLTIHDNTGCTATYCHEVVVAPIQSGDCDAFFGWYQVQGTQTIHFIDSSFSNHDITSYSWNFGDGHEGDGQNPNHYFPVGTYEVCLTIHDNTGCTDTYCTVVTVLPETPGDCNALFSYEQINGTQNIHFTNLSTSDHDINSNFWSFGDGHNGDGQNPTHEYQNPGTYEVCLIIHDNTGCTDTFCLEINVELVVPGPCEALFQWYQISGTQTIHFVDSSYSAHDITSYSWNFGDGHEGDGQNPNHYFPVGTYEVCLTIVDNTGCTDTYCTTVTVEPEAPGDCMALFGYFQGENTLTIHFIDSSSSSHDITTWHWDFGDGHTSNDHNITHFYEHAGTYEVCLTIHDNHDCNDTYCTVITVNPVEAGNCEASFEYSQAENSLNVHFFNTSTSEHEIISRFWTFGDGSSGDGNDPHHIYDHPGTYLVCLTIHDNSGCEATHCDSIIVNSVPEGDCHAFFTWFQSENSLTIHFQDSSSSSHDITTWFWDFGDGHESHDHFITHTYGEPGTYEVCLTIHDNGDCNDTYCTVVTVLPINGNECQAAFQAQLTSSGLTVTLTNTSTNTTPNTNYLWEFGDGTSSTEENPVHTYSHTDTYTICLFITDTTTECESHVCQVINAHPIAESHNLRYSLPEHGATVNRDKFTTDVVHSIAIFPNPTSITTSIEYDLKENADVNIELSDLYGNRIRQVTNEKELIGIHNHTVDTGNLSPGIYIFKVKINQEILIRKITITQ